MHCEEKKRSLCNEGQLEAMGCQERAGSVYMQQAEGLRHGKKRIITSRQQKCSLMQSILLFLCIVASCQECVSGLTQSGPRDFRQKFPVSREDVIVSMPVDQKHLTVARGSRAWRKVTSNSACLLAAQHLCNGMSQSDKVSIHLMTRLDCIFLHPCGKPCSGAGATIRYSKKLMTED